MLPGRGRWRPGGDEAPAPLSSTGMLAGRGPWRPVSCSAGIPAITYIALIDRIQGVWVLYTTLRLSSECAEETDVLGLFLTTRTHFRMSYDVYFQVVGTAVF